MTTLNDSIEKISNEIKDKEKELIVENNKETNISKLLSDNLKDLISLFQYKDNIPTIELIEKTMNLGFSSQDENDNITFKVKYPTLIKENTLNYIYTLKSGILLLKTNIEINNNNTANTFLKTVMETNNIVFELDNKNLTFLFSEFYSLKNKHKKITRSIYTLQENIKKLQEEKKLQDFFYTLPQLNKFCINTFLCKEFGVENKNDIKSLNKKIMQSNKGLHPEYKYFDFLIYEIDYNSIGFHKCTLRLNLSNCELALNNKNHISITGKRNINEVLSNQFSLNGTIVSLDYLRKNQYLKSFFLTDLSKLEDDCSYYLKYEDIYENLNVLKVNNKINNF